MQENGHVRPLAVNALPELMSISEREALEYVTDLLENLIHSHESQPSDYSTEEHTRRPSYETKLEMTPNITSRLLPRSSLYSDAIGHEEGHLEGEELYKRFWLKELPPISVHDYLQRFQRYCKSCPATYLTAGRLIYHASVELNLIPVTRLNVYRLFCASFIISAKFLEDELYSMSRYATTAGLKKEELSRIELSFLLLINFEVKADREALKAGLRNWAGLKDRQPSQAIC